MTSSMSCSTRKMVTPEALMLRMRCDQVGALGGVHAGGGFVEKQQSRVGGERPGDLDQALRAIGKARRGQACCRSSPTEARACMARSRERFSSLR